MSLSKVNLEEIANGRTELLQQFVNAGGDVNMTIAVEDTTWTPLFFFAAAGSQNAVSCALDLGAEASRKSPEGYTAAHIAARFGHVEVLQYLLSRGLDVRDADVKGRNVLHFAAAFGQLPVVRFLCDRSPDLSSSVDRFGSTASDYATEHGFFDVVQFLSSFGSLPRKEGKRRELKNWLEAIDCVQYLGVLLENGYDLESLSDLGAPSESDLDSMGVTARMDRRKLSTLYKFPRAAEAAADESGDSSDSSDSEESSGSSDSEEDSSSDSGDSEDDSSDSDSDSSGSDDSDE